MKMPVRVRPLPNQPVWRVNEDPQLLDAMYDKILGTLSSSTKGSEMLDAETKVRTAFHTTLSMETNAIHQCSGSP